jgi:DNA adenine methylase
MAEMRAFLNYPGAKWGMAEQIVSMMPKHRSYLEPYFGSGAVLFNKPPSPIETVNDIDGDITNFFRVLRAMPNELAEAISMTPYSRDVFNDAHENKGMSEFDRAYRFAIRSRMGHGFKTYQKTGFKIDVYGRDRSYCVDCWNRMPEQLLEAAVRLKGVQIENRPAVEMIKRFNHENVLIYADPPYLLSTRGGKQYKHEMNEQDHVDLLAALKEHKGYAIISGYPSELYSEMLRDWDSIERRSYNQNSDARTEVLWFNFGIGGQMMMQEVEE